MSTQAPQVVNGSSPFAAGHRLAPKARVAPVPSRPPTEVKSGMPDVSRIVLCVISLATALATIGAFAMFAVTFLAAGSVIEQAAIGSGFTCVFLAGYIVSRCIERVIYAFSI